MELENRLVVSGLRVTEGGDRGDKLRSWSCSDLD